MEQTRGKLEHAAASRLPCRIGRPRGTWVPGVLIRSTEEGLVCNAPGHTLRDGEEVRLWFETEGESAWYEATVGRLGVAVPDRGTDGVQLRWVSEILAPEGAGNDGAVVEILLPGGAAISLLERPARLVDVAIARIEFELPRDYPIVFPSGGPLRMRLASLAESPCEIRGRITRIVDGPSTLHYTLGVELVERADLHRLLVARLASAI